LSVWFGNADESESEASDVPTSASNVRKDLNEFQEKHATLVLTTVKVNSDYSFKKLIYSKCVISFSCCRGISLCVTICNIYLCLVPLLEEQKLIQ
jgi:hypothetical protein